MASEGLQGAHASSATCAASMKGKGVGIITGPTTPPNKNTSAVAVVDSDNTHISLAKLTFGTACTVRVMVCRKWESTDLKGNPISTDYIISDEQGGDIHCTAWRGISHRFTKALEEGNCCTIEGFTLKPNKEKFRVRNGDKHCIHLEGNTVVKKLQCDTSLFQRYPFQLTPFEDIALNGSKFLLDVIGIVSRIGHINPTRNNSQLLDIHIQNERGKQLRVTLWGNLCDEFVERNACAQPNYILILPGMHVKEWKGEIYLSSTSATSIQDAKEINEIGGFKSLMMNTHLSPIVHPLSPQVPREGTLLQLLHLGREQKENNKIESIALHCKVKIANVRTKHGWYYFSCAIGRCKKGLTKVDDQFWCDSCANICEFPQTRYRLHLDISDESSSMAITAFDEIAEALLKKTASKLLEEVGDYADESVLPEEIQSLTNTYHLLELKTHTYFNHGDHESFTASKLVRSLPSPKDATYDVVLQQEVCPEAEMLHTKGNLTVQDLSKGANTSAEGMQLRGKTEPLSKKPKLSGFSSPSEQIGALQADSNTTDDEH